MTSAPFFAYMNAALTPYHAAAASRDLLLAAGFTPLPEAGPWPLAPGGRYLVEGDDGLFLAFVLPATTPVALHIVGTHNDSPALRIKPAPTLVREGLSQLNIEVYGGPILSTWLDRPLRIAGRVFTRGRDWTRPDAHRIALPEQVAIPSLAAHMKRGEGAIDPQKELLPVWGLADAPSLEARLAEVLGCEPSALLGSELYLVSAEAAACLGTDAALYSAPRIDNLANAYAATCALRDCQPATRLALFISYQHEEIGSRSRVGAAGPRLAHTLERLAAALGCTRDTLLADSLLLSCDQAHAVHPNYAEKADPLLRPRLGGGPVCKLAASHSYATTPRGEAILRALCAQENIPLQTFANRADMRGGSTIGPLAEGTTGIETIDIGSPMLAMHSIRELAHLGDQAQMQRLITAFLSA